MTEPQPITNAEFIAAVFGERVPEGAFAAVCTKPGDPSKGGWTALRVDDPPPALPDGGNNFLNCSSFFPGDDGSFKARKGNFAACHILMLDDIGSKVPMDRLGDFKLSWLIETSPGNYQGGITPADPLVDGAVATRILNAIIDADLCDAGASSPLTRWARLPLAINGKTKHLDEAGQPFRCRLVEWRPESRYTPTEIVDQLELELAPAGRLPRTGKRKKAERPPWEGTGDPAQTETETPELRGVLTRPPFENPVVTALKERGLYKREIEPGKYDVTCPWVYEHADALGSGTAYFEPSETYPLGGFKCQHSHGDQYRIGHLLKELSVAPNDARHLPLIRLKADELHTVVDAAEEVLNVRGRHYQAGGLIVSIAIDPTTGDPSIVATSAQALTRELSTAAIWERFDGRAMQWVRADPPSRPVSVLYDGQSFRHLPPLGGLARQPYFRETDGELVVKPGYDGTTHRFAVFDPGQFRVATTPTEADARAALAALEQLLVEFHFVDAIDKAAALAAILTAVVRPSLPHAPAFHVRAPIFGSGKTYLCELIGAFSGPADNNKVSYPPTSEEATKVILALLLTSPACVEFDDMDSDWIPHGVIKRALTAETITDRILGVSKTATVSTRTLFLGSGNNVGPVRDLLRRVLTINLDPRCAIPATINYNDVPVDRVRRERGRYVSAALTVIAAWRVAGSPRTDAATIATYNGAWSDYCRQPLLWLGHPDPATALLEQLAHDPDRDTLGGLMREWYAAFGSTPTTVRKAVEEATFVVALGDAISEFPVEERGLINRSKFGWILRKNANRIVDGYEFRAALADGRKAWQVVRTETPASPALPPSTTERQKIGCERVKAAQESLNTA